MLAGVNHAIQGSIQYRSGTAEIEPDKATVAEISPGGQTDTLLFKEGVRVVHLQTAGVNPGQIGCLRACQRQAGHFLQAFRQPVAVAAQIVQLL